MENSVKENTKAIRECFSRISITKGCLSVLFLIILIAIGVAISMNELNSNSAWGELIIAYAIYVISFLLILWVLRRANVPISSIFKGDSDNISQVLMVVPLIAISIGVIWVIIIGLHLVSAEAAESYLNWLNSIDMFNFGPETTLLQYALIFGIIAIVAPVVEEIIFRGIMIERFGAKYSYGAAIIISSIIFAILHVSPLGAFIVGVFLALVYLKTESLMIPILIHIANNAIAIFLSIAFEKFGFEYGIFLMHGLAYYFSRLVSFGLAGI